MADPYFYVNRRPFVEGWNERSPEYQAQYAAFRRQVLLRMQHRPRKELAAIFGCTPARITQIIRKQRRQELRPPLRNPSEWEVKPSLTFEQAVRFRATVDALVGLLETRRG